MTILRWLLCHLLIIIVLVSLSLGYVFRDSLKDDFNSMTVKSNQLVKNESPAVENTGNTQDSSKIKSSGTKDKRIADFQQAPASRSDAGKLPVKQQKSAVLDGSSPTAGKAADPWGQKLPGQTETKISQDSANKKEPQARVSSFPPDDYVPEQNGSVSESSAGETTSVRNTQTMTVSPTNPKNDHMDRSPGMPDAGNATSKTMAYQEALAKVRQLYWNGKIDPALEIYEKLMFDYPSQPEAAAELGNIFLQQGNLKAAIWAYQNAIPRYLNLHREQEAINLTRFISQYDPAIAESLQKRYW